MSDIKVGSWVQLVDWDGGYNVKNGDVLEVKSVNSTFVGFEFDDGPSWLHNRFKLVPAPVAVPTPRTRAQVAADRRKELLDAVVSHHSAGLEVNDDWLSEIIHGR